MARLYIVYLFATQILQKDTLKLTTRKKYEECGEEAQQKIKAYKPWASSFDALAGKDVTNQRIRELNLVLGQEEIVLAKS